VRNATNETTVLISGILSKHRHERYGRKADHRYNYTCHGFPFQDVAQQDMLWAMSPIVGSVYLVSYNEDIDEFCATVEIEVPQNVAHLRLELEKFGPNAYARNLTNPKPGPASIGVLGCGKPNVKFGDQIQGRCFTIGEVPD
jgi:hypothetical protein